MTIEQALENLRKAVRSVTANADTHDVLRVSLDVIVDNLKPQEQEVKDDKPASN